ncbi:MAG: hypothetical protein FJ109_18940, partial [Deltaproteobacteria bacterium]|nr:hypothetical protein [Deltaproteobacteria bacterium]
MVTKQRIADILVQPTGPQDLGAHKVRVRVTDGCLYAELTFEIQVILAGGYAVWQPAGTSDLFATRIKEAIVAAGRQAQVVADLAPFGDLSSLDGVFVAAGVYGNKHILLDSEVQKLVQYLAKGGKVYLEGGDTWYVDPYTPLHAYFKVTGVADGDQKLTATQVGLHFCNGLSFLPSSDYEVNNFLDRVNKLPGGIPVLGWNDTALHPSAVAYEDAAAKYRTIGAAVPFALLVDKGGNTADLMDRYLDFLEKGWPQCLSDLYCNDSRPCTKDTCGADKKCVNAPISDCVECTNDSHCKEAEACKGSGAVNDLICQEIPGARYDSTDTPKAIDTLPGNAVVTSSINVAGTSKVISASAKLYIAHSWKGDLAIKLEHGGKTAQLKLQDPTDKTLNAYVTYEFGVPANPPGGMAKFNNLSSTGEWKLTVTDTVPGFHAGNLLKWSLFLVTEDGWCGGGKSCDDGDVCTKDACYFDWCTHKPEDCTDVDGNGKPVLCTIDSCDPVAGCVHTPKSCDDFKPCTQNLCEPATGSCIYPQELNCISACTTHKDCGLYDYCDAVSGTCKPIPGQPFHSADPFPVAVPDSDPVWVKRRSTCTSRGAAPRMTSTRCTTSIRLPARARWACSTASSEAERGPFRSRTGSPATPVPWTTGSSSSPWSSARTTWIATMRTSAPWTRASPPGTAARCAPMLRSTAPTGSSAMGRNCATPRPAARPASPPSLPTASRAPRISATRPTTSWCTRPPTRSAATASGARGSRRATRSRAAWSAK